MRILAYTLAITALVANQVFGAADWERWGPTYEAKTAAQKEADLWNQIKSNTQSNRWFSSVEFAGIFIESMDPTIKWVGDTFQNGFAGPRNKYIHTVGSTGTVKFVPTANSEGYTGLFKGADHAILRMSLAIQPDQTKTTPAGADGNFAPGIGLKFLRDGMPSGNLVAMYSVDGQPSWNFFEFPFSNHIQDPKGAGQQALGAKFATATPKIKAVGLSDIASFDQSGKKETNVKLPFELIFVPNPSIKKQFTSSFTKDFRDQIETIPVGTDVYTVFAKSTPTANQVQIGKITTTSKLTKSYFGDRYLFFKHQDMREDIKIHPEWDSKILLSEESGCPFKNAWSTLDTVSSVFKTLTGQYF